MPTVSRHANAQLKAGARHYSCETGYPFDDSRHIGNSFNFEMNNPPDFIRQFRRTEDGLSVTDSLCTAPTSQQKKLEKGCLTLWRRGRLYTG